MTAKGKAQEYEIKLNIAFNITPGFITACNYENSMTVTANYTIYDSSDSVIDSHEYERSDNDLASGWNTDEDYTIKTSSPILRIECSLYVYIDATLNTDYERKQLVIMVNNVNKANKIINCTGYKTCGNNNVSFNYPWYDGVDGSCTCDYKTPILPLAGQINIKFSL
ncbi:MAG: hypothetical protein J6D03_10615 [Clostridia bacterium]|nr:hypothetical protein [Clostridia bacterium]